MDWRARLLRQTDDEVRPVIEKRLEAGTVLFRAGDPCPGVALIHEGVIELRSGDGDVPERFGIRGKGAFVGDDAVLGAGICRHTAVALRRTTVEMLARDVFLQRFAATVEPPDTAAAAPVLLPLAGRTAAVARLLPASPASADLLPAAGLSIDCLPFVVGRAATSADVGSADRQPGLLVHERRPYRLSRRQFVVVGSGTGVALTDPGSRLGTFVDGERLGMEPRAVGPGQTVEICAGGAGSPYRFRLSAAG